MAGIKDALTMALRFFYKNHEAQNSLKTKNIIRIPGSNYLIRITVRLTFGILLTLQIKRNYQTIKTCFNRLHLQYLAIFLFNGAAKTLSNESNVNNQSFKRLN